MSSSSSPPVGGGGGRRGGGPPVWVVVLTLLVLTARLTEAAQNLRQILADSGQNEKPSIAGGVVDDVVDEAIPKSNEIVEDTADPAAASSSIDKTVSNNLRRLAGEQSTTDDRNADEVEPDFGYWLTPIAALGLTCGGTNIKSRDGQYVCIKAGEALCQDNDGGPFGRWTFGIIEENGQSTVNLWTPKNEVAWTFCTDVTHVCIGEERDPRPNKFSNERPYLYFYDEKTQRTVGNLTCDGTDGFNGENLGKPTILKMADNSDVGMYANYNITVLKFKKGQTPDPGDSNELFNITVNRVGQDVVGSMSFKDSKCRWTDQCPNIPTRANPFILNPVDDLNSLVQRVGDSYLTRISNQPDSVIEPTTSAAGSTSTWIIKVNEGASYNSLHFSDFDFDPGCEMVVSGDPIAGVEQRYVMSGFGKLNLRNFWAKHIKGDTITITTMCAGGLQTTDSARFVIDEIGVGYPQPVNDDLGGRQLEICGADDKRDAVCYNETHPTEYSKGRAVAKLLIVGKGSCTGWLASKSDRFFTNEHCCETPQWALDTDYEFMFEATACDGTTTNTEVVLSGAKAIKINADLDYALVQHIDVTARLMSPTSLAKTYGFLELDNRSAVLDERIYIPQHPRGRDKEIAINSTMAGNPKGVCEIDSLTQHPSSNTPPTFTGYGYLCDTEFGSSGSPVIASSSQKVIALHNSFGEPAGCGGTGSRFNRGYRSDMIYEETHDLLDVIYENDFETINPNLPPQVPQCGGATYFGIGNLFNSPGIAFLEKPMTTIEAVLMNGRNAFGAPLYVNDPLGPDSGEHVLGMFSNDYAVAGERKEDALAILFHSKGFESLVIDFEFAPGAIPPSDCTQELPYEPDIFYRSELHFLLVDVPSGELNWNDLTVIQEGTVYSSAVDGAHLRSESGVDFEPYIIEWTHGTVTFSKAGDSENGNVALVIYAHGDTYYNFLDNIVITGKDEEPECETDDDCPSDSVCNEGTCVRKGNPRFTLTWFGDDDLDLHAIPPGGEEIYFANKVDPVTGGNLDEDRIPDRRGWWTENINVPTGPDGTYTVWVDQYDQVGGPDSFQLLFAEDANEEDPGEIIYTYDGTDGLEQGTTSPFFSYRKPEGVVEITNAVAAGVPYSIASRANGSEKKKWKK